MGNVFFKLLNMSIAAGWLVLAVAALRLVFKKAPRWVFCVLWAMVALRLALPFSVQSPFSVVPSVNTVSVVTEPVSSDPVSVPDEYSAPQTAIPAEVSSPQGYVSQPEHSAPESYVSRPAYTEPVTPPAIPGTVDPAQTDNAHQQIQRIVIKTGIPAIDNTISAAETERAYTGEEQTGDIGAVLFWIWASGAALMASYAAFSYLRLRLRLRCSIKGADGAYVCDTIDTPFILGLFRPRIYVPSGMNGRERSYVLAHEKAHLRRFDHLWKPLGYLMLAAYWFNPLMWLAYIFFCRDIEIACDEKVVKTLDTESKAGYSQTLLDLNRPRRMISACPLAFGEVGVKERIKKVLSYKKPTLWILIAALLLTTVLAVCLMTDPKEKSAEALPKELQMLKSGDYYMELCYEDVVSESDMKAVLVFARKDGVASRSGINRMKNYEAQSNYTLLCSDGMITFINTYKHTYYAPIYPVCVTDHGYEMFALVAENEYKLSEHLQPEGGAEAYVFEKDGEKLTFEYENGELKRVKFPKSVGFDEDTAFEVLLFTDKVPEDMMFSVPEGYRDLGADTPEDEKCDSIEFCNHYGEYDVERFDIDALLKEFENKGYLLISPSELDYIEAPLEHAYAVLAGSGPAVWVYAYESAEKAAEDYRTEKLEDLTPRSVFEMLRWPAEHSRIRVNEYVFTVYDDILAGIDHHTLAAEIMNALGIEIPVYTAPAQCVVKHLDKDISADFAELLAGRGYEVYAAQGDGELCDKFWVAVAPDGSAASIAHSSPAEYAGALIYAANELWYCLEDSVYISGYGAPVTVTALNSGYTVFANPAKSNELIKIITGETEPDATPDEYFEFSKLSDGTYSIAAKQRTDLPEELVLPGTYNGKPVTKIAERAFYDRTGIKSVKIPESVIAINKMAFSGCTSLVNVELPQGLTTIASGAFKKCAFSEFIVPQSVTFIGSGAFGGCNMLQRIELPFIGETPDPSELPYGFIGHIFGTRFGDSEKIYEFIPRSLKEVVVAEGCVRIPYGAFAQCESLERITLPGSLISIGSFAFEGCGGLVEILYGSTADKWQTVQKSASWDRGDDGTYYDLNVVCTNENDPAVFEKNFKYELLEDGTYCVKLDYRYKTPEELVIPSEHEGAAVTAVELSDLRFVTRIVLPQTVTRVISLKDCTSLTDITLPDSVAEIGENAFVGCTKLKSVKIPKNVARIGVSPFAWCPSLETIEVDEGNERYRAVSGCLIDDATGTIIGSAVYCTVPADEKVTRIGPAALAGVRMENIVIPSNITEIGNSAFSESGARTITLSEGVTTLGMDLCEKCFDLKDLYIPVSVQAINENTFCLTIPDEDPELTIHYAGSREEWAAITSEWPWDVERLDRCVVCLGSVAPVFTPAEEGSCFFTCNLFPGKTVIRSLYNGNTYFVVNEVLFEKEYPSGSAIMFKGQRLMVNGKGGLSVDDCYGAYSPSASGAFGCYYKLEQIGGLIVYEDDYDGTFCSGTVFAENMYDFDRYYTGENYMLLWYAGAMSSEPEWKVLTLDGKVCTLPVPDDKRWAVKSIEFDTSSEDPDDVIVYVYEYKEGYAESQPAAYKANLRRDTRVLEGDAVNAYYCEPVYEFEEYEFDTAVKAPVYIAAGVAGYELPAKAAAYGYEQSLYYTNKDAFGAEVKSYIESFLHAMTGDYITVGVTVYEGYPWGNVNHSDCRILSDGNGRLRFDMYENKLQQLESAPNVNNVFDLNIKYLDDLMDFMGFDKTRLKAYTEPGRIVLMEPASDAADYAYKRSFESIALYVDECRVYEIDAVRRQPEKLAEYETVSYAQALEELANGRYVVPYYNTENGESEEPVYVYDCVLEYAADIYGISDYVPFYRFTVELEIDVGDLYAYVPAVKIN